MHEDSYHLAMPELSGDVGFWCWCMSGLSQAAGTPDDSARTTGARASTVTAPMTRGKWK
jgi:hypothetical protein